MYSDYFDSIGIVAQTDKEVADAMSLELKRQRDNIELIASENLVSPQVMAAMGSVLTNKYAEVSESAITAAASMLTSLRISQSSAHVSFSVVNMQMFSLTRAHRLTLPFILHFSNRAIP